MLHFSVDELFCQRLMLYPAKILAQTWSFFLFSHLAEASGLLGQPGLHNETVGEGEKREGKGREGRERQE